MNRPLTKSIMKALTLPLALIALSLILAGCSAAGGNAAVPPSPTATTAPQPTALPVESGGMQMDMGAAPTVPAGLAYAEGQEIRFIHTEVSDPDIAKLLSDMMSSPVLYVPSLAKAPPEMLANVYVFQNGIQGMGPLGFQPDVFDNPPGNPDYTPLRTIILVTWKDETQARELKSVAEVTAAEAKGEITLEQPGVVVNMPFITWPGGER